PPTRSPLFPYTTLFRSYGRTKKGYADGSALQFTPNSDANELIRRDPFAFVLAVVMDQGITAERAWLAPYLLKERLGHLDPARIRSEEHTSELQSPCNLV